MSEYQRVIWQAMLNRIDEYRKGQVAFGQLIRDLEGQLDAARIKNTALVAAWYSHWTPLEIHNAVVGDRITIDQVSADLAAMEKFLRAAIED